METGPHLIELILSLLLQFRNNAVGATANIGKAFLKISLAPKDREFLKFLCWKDFDKKEMMTLKHHRVLFRVTPSPFLLSATSLYHLG
jgi:hypothetical protein